MSIKCDYCGRFVCESGDDSTTVTGGSTYDHQTIPPREGSVICHRCVAKRTNRSRQVNLDDNAQLLAVGGVPPRDFSGSIMSMLSAHLTKLTPPSKR
jgi:hypothetical protein